MPKYRDNTRFTLPSRIGKRSLRLSDRIGARGRTSDARQAGDFVERAWEVAAELIADTNRRAMQIAGARVVAEAGPQMQHVVDRRIGERCGASESAS